VIRVHANIGAFREQNFIVVQLDAAVSECMFILNLADIY
jgi:hypothetical protein